MLPKSFGPFGVLLQDYEATFAELWDSLLIKGPLEDRPVSWDEPWRRTLLGNAEGLVRQLWAVGITTIYLDGSFVTRKGHPADIDGCFRVEVADYESGELEKRLNKAAPKTVWGWTTESMIMIGGKQKLKMWGSYKVELWPFADELPGGINTSEGLIPLPDGFRLERFLPVDKGLILLKKD